MPVTVSYPGVYVEEIPSGVRTITGVATSITAFIGRALRGPTNQAVTINSYADFERTFGGLWTGSTLGYAVRDFYLNGGSQAIIVRLYNPDDPAKPAKAALSVGGLTLEAASEGAWGQNLRATLDQQISPAVEDRLKVPHGALFNLTVKDTAPGGVTELIRNLTVVDSARRIDKVLALESNLVRWQGVWPPNPLPTPTPGDDPVSQAEAALPSAQAALKAAQAALAAAQALQPADATAVKTAAAALKTAQTSLDNATKAAATAAAPLQVTDGQPLTVSQFEPPQGQLNKQGLFALEQADLFNLLCIPPHSDFGDLETNLIADAAAYCETRRAMLLVDPPSTWETKDAAKTGVASIGTNSKNAVLFFPRVLEFDPLNDNRLEKFAPCGAVAGVFARTDTQRGVWKAPAGLDATLVGVPQLSVNLTDDENGELNPLGVNCLRSLPAAGRVVWGSRTLQGDDRLASEWKYVPVRRLALFLEESLYRGTQWVVFEPNDEPLWAQIRLNIGAFMQNLFRQGAFQGQTPREAYFVKCDKETTTQNDVDLGRVNIVVGFAPLKPAEFVILQIQQIAGQIVT
jgi:uncharacterized protein